ncbi:hypothetical protein DERP_010221 [Dermatophagoides pteronyssinus]|uniref:Uncharacterized protein n=1 Tax=Dermatophagoides pteronyssinus TaxID=6956 RepID=A0ABQ8J734_DERPT|nr:hypothetical protein DERP_010221 [Dermatophagoides pteronyssinus]
MYGISLSSQTAGKWHIISIGVTSPANTIIPRSPLRIRSCTSFNPIRSCSFRDCLLALPIGCAMTDTNFNF